MRNGLRPLSEADFEAIEAAMGKSIARAVDNGSLLWQENAVVALGREEPREAPIPAIEPIQEHAPWDALEGYVDDASASFAGQVEAAPSRQELQRLLREEKAAAQLLCRLAHEKMLPCPAPGRDFSLAGLGMPASGGIRDARQSEWHRCRPILPSHWERLGVLAGR